MKKGKQLIYALICVLLVAILYTIFIFSHPVRRPENVIRNDILKLTPIGTDMAVVLNIVNEKVETDGWKIRIVRDNIGYADDSKVGSPTVGKQSIIVNMGKSMGGFISVDLSWGFDSEGKLIDIYVRKMYTLTT